MLQTQAEGSFFALTGLVEAREGEGDKGPGAGLQGALVARRHMSDGGLKDLTGWRLRLD